MKLPLGRQIKLWRDHGNHTLNALFYSYAAQASEDIDATVRPWNLGARLYRLVRDQFFSVWPRVPNVPKPR
jgi:hypothetical protein